MEQERIYVANVYHTYAICLLSIENLRFQATLSLIEVNSVCFDDKQEIIRVKHTNSSIFQHPSVGNPKFDTQHVGG